ncbi:hypothetical protein Acr_28g0008100 [Actinidia rufa]|uniref:Uncharacterized protein n=1 Tax=Actinidia rufa TaxID=165716 RepID=A0A7J0HAV6_9ERIC|nr:hypothetical protein Acr_28g0008100 [Actinidia rufa]
MLEMKNLDQVKHDRKGKTNAVSEERNLIYSNPSRFAADPEYFSDKMIVQPSGAKHVGSALKKQKLGHFTPETESESESEWRQSSNRRDNKELIQFRTDALYKEADPFSINPIKTDKINTNFKIKDEDLLFKLELGPSNRYYIDSVKRKKTRTNMTRSEDVSPDGSCKGQCGVVERENTKPLETKMIRLFGKDIHVERTGDANMIQASYEVKRVGNLGDDSRNGECIVSEEAPCETERIILFGKDIYVRMHK